MDRDAYANMSPEKRESVLSAARERQQVRRAAFSDEQRQNEKERLRAMYMSRRDYFMARNKEWRENMSDEQRERAREAARRSTARNKGSILAKQANYRNENRERVRESARRWRAGNRDTAAARSKESREKKIEQYRRKTAEWAKRNPQRVRAKWAKYRAAAFRATPPWFDKVLVEEAYHLAQLRGKATGFTWHVDHIVPLQSPLVCGLHTIENLQVIPGALNVAKGNRYWPGMPGEEKRA